MINFFAFEYTGSLIIFTNTNLCSFKHTDLFRPLLHRQGLDILGINFDVSIIDSFIFFEAATESVHEDSVTGVGVDGRNPAIRLDLYIILFIDKVI